MERDLRYVELFELYQSLLTERQRELFSSHYIFDLSLSEIAEPEGNSRQSVYSAVKKVKQKLDQFESELHFYEKNKKLYLLAQSLVEKDKKVCDQILEIIGK